MLHWKFDIYTERELKYRVVLSLKFQFFPPGFIIHVATGARQCKDGRQAKRYYVLIECFYRDGFVLRWGKYTQNKTYSLRGLTYKSGFTMYRAPFHVVLTAGTCLEQPNTLLRILFVTDDITDTNTAIYALANVITYDII